MLTLLLTTVLLSAGHRVPAPPRAPSAAAAFAELGYPRDLPKERLRGLLQSFADAGWDRRFRRLGDEDDFDHGHLLIDARSGRPRAILYHTQELVADAPEGRNWLQWLDGRGIEDARAYERAAYPRSGAWDWFVARDLPRLRARGTVLDKMLDPVRLGFEPGAGRQWTFTRVACGSAAEDPSSSVLRVSRSDGSPVCLALGAPL
ncbi:MAG: hypothetical protein HY079_06840 [Elusimicrobia bacterium]|nr:hypothetical protein [Elusimicrobiota bacterium]